VGGGGLPTHLVLFFPRPLTLPLQVAELEAWGGPGWRVVCEHLALRDHECAFPTPGCK